MKSESAIFIMESTNMKKTDSNPLCDGTYLESGKNRESITFEPEKIDNQYVIEFAI